MGLAACSLTAQALTVTSFSPQGEVARIRQVVAKFDSAAVNFGDPKAPAPLTVNCNDAEAGKGTGRWTSEREWVYDFQADLPPGVRCTATVKPGFKSAAGAALTGATSYQFNTGGPFVQSVRPGTYQEIDEEQFFVMQLNGAATTASVQENVWCVADGVGERIPVRLIEGQQRLDLLKSLGLTQSAERQPLRYAALTCNRRLTSGSQLQLVFGKGVATPSGVANAVERRFNYKVRQPFAAEFRCERENAQSACLPIRPMQLSFNAPVPRKLAEGIRLQSGKETLKPQIEGEGNEGDTVVSEVQFIPPFTADTPFTLQLPRDFKDASGRTLRNADSFPLKVATGSMPPLAKFAASPFGIVERFAEGPQGPALLPVTLRNVEAALKVQGLQPGQTQDPSKVTTLQPTTDADIIAWFRKVRRYDGYTIQRSEARRDVKGALPAVIDDNEKSYVQTRMLSLLGGQSGVKTLDLPKPVNNDPRPFEVVGIPLPQGFHVVEIASPLLGRSLLDERHGAARTMYVRTSALVTNLSVHFKLGRENAAAWVTTLDKGQVVPNAQVRVSSCDGRELATATTNAQGVATFDGLSPEAPTCRGNDWNQAYFVSARATGADGVPDMAFTWSDWQRGIEPWRFNVPTSSNPQPDEIAHTIFDRTLLRAGETVSMKHLLRSQNRQGFGLPDSEPQTLVITHVGSGQQFTQPIAWRKTATGGMSAENTFAVPPAAKLGVYEVVLRGAGGRERSFSSGQFRVEEFRLPVLEGRVGPTDKKPLVRVRSVPTDVQINYVAGGGAANLPVRVSALVRGKSLQYSDFDAFSFSPPRRRDAAASASSDDEEASASQDARVIADKLPITLDKNGAGKLAIDNVPASTQPQELVIEATYADPSGEVQTLRSTHALWPAAVVAGVKTEGWVSAAQKIRFQALALGLDGKIQADVPLSVQAIARITTTSRKRMVGGFYSYDNKTETKDLGTVCTGKSDSRGLLLCETKLDEAGEVELVVTARDKDGNEARAASSVWVTRQGELWFGGEDHDRIDLLPEKKSYQPGETAKLQVRMPFRHATALVSIEREGIIDTRVVQLNGQDPTVNVKIEEGWGPNVYVSVLALRGRLREVPW